MYDYKNCEIQSRWDKMDPFGRSEFLREHMPYRTEEFYDSMSQKVWVDLPGYVQQTLKDQ